MQRPSFLLILHSLITLILCQDLNHKVSFNHTSSSERTDNHHHHHSSHKNTHHNHHNQSAKIAFLFLLRYNLPLLEVWEEFFTFRANPRHYNIYVHSTIPYTFPSHSVFHNRTIAKHLDAKWGTISLVQASRILYEAALDDPDNQFFPFLSDSCVPIYAFSKWYRILTSNPSPKSIVNACPFPEEEGMERDTRWKGSLDKSPNMKKEYWRKSGEWVLLIRKHAELFVRSEGEIQYWDQIPCADEHVLPSLLAMNRVENETTCSDGLTHVYWRSLIDAHPYSYSAQEIDQDLLFHFRYGKVIYFHQNPDKVYRYLNYLCAGYDGICHFAARKFSPATKLELLSKLSLFLMDDRDDIFFNPHPPPANSSVLLNAEYRQSGAGSYPGFDFAKRLFPNVRRKKSNEANPDELYYHDNGHNRIFPDLESMKFYLHLPLSNESDAQLLASIPVITDEEAKAPLLHNFYPAKQNTLIKMRRQASVFLIRGHERHFVPNMDTALSLNAGNIITIPDHHMHEIPIGAPIPPL